MFSNRKPPVSVSNYAEVITQFSRYTIGHKHSRQSTKYRFFGSIGIHVLVDIYFENRLIPNHLQINHKDGSGDHFHKDTYLPNGDYSNYLWTLYRGTAHENSEDFAAYRKRHKSNATMNSKAAKQ